MSDYFYAALKLIALIGLFFLSAILMITAILFYWCKFTRKNIDKALDKLDCWIEDIMHA